MNAFEFGQVVGAGLEKQANKYKFLTNLIAPAANAAAPAATKVVSRAGTAAPSWMRNNQAVARGINPATGLKPGAVAPAPPVPPPVPSKVTISPAEAAAGRAKVTITPEQAAAAPPLPKPPGLRTPSAVQNYGSVPTGAPSTAQAQSFFDNATSGGRQRMLGIDPQGRGVAQAPRSWAELAPEQQAAVQRFYSGGK